MKKLSAYSISRKHKNNAKNWENIKKHDCLRVLRENLEPYIYTVSSHIWQERKFELTANQFLDYGMSQKG